VLDALSRLIRHSTLVARSKAGCESLTTDALARRLARRPLADRVTAMRRALGGRFKVKKAQPQTPAPAPAPEPPALSGGLAGGLAGGPSGTTKQ
jgi:hypothetical protein